MRKISMLLCIVLTMFVVSDAQKSHAASKEQPDVQKSPAVSKEQADLPVFKPGLPDLTCTVKFVHIKENKNSNGVSCYSPNPSFTITNKGKSEAKDFVYTIEWKLGPGHTWQVYTCSNPTISLGPGETKPIDGSGPAWDQFWCTDQPDWKPGWRIKVDTTNVVEESSETNNMAMEVYTPIAMPMSDPPRAIQKGIQKPLEPQTNTAPIRKMTPLQVK